VCVCVCVYVRVVFGTIGSGCDLLKLHCDPLEFQQPSLHTKLDPETLKCDDHFD